MIALQKKDCWLGCALFLLLVAFLISPWDYAFTKWLEAHPILWFSSFMDRSCFEGNKFGGGDFATIYMIAGILLYITAWLPRSPNRLRRWRPELGFIVASSLITTVYVVHGLKWTIGRVRPLSVQGNGALPFTRWFEAGPYNLLDGFFSGSFPSGHTATITIFLTLAYILAFHRRWNRYRLGLFIGLTTIGLAYLMAMARSMNHSHFATDGMAIIPLTWLIIHFLFFRILNIPQQQELVAHASQVPKLPACWELRLCGLGLFLVLGLMAISLGIRGWHAGAPLPAVALCCTGLVLTIFFAGKVWRFYSPIAEIIAQATKTTTDPLPQQGTSSSDSL